MLEFLGIFAIGVVFGVAAGGGTIMETTTAGTQVSAAAMAGPGLDISARQGAP
jgi:hypothetical protein